MKIELPQHLNLQSFQFSEMPYLAETGRKARERARERLKKGELFQLALQNAVDEILKEEKAQLKPGGKLRLLEKTERHRLIYFLQIQDDKHYSDADLLGQAILKHLESHLEGEAIKYEQTRSASRKKPYATPPLFEQERRFREFQDQLHAQARFELSQQEITNLEKQQFVKLVQEWLYKQEIELEVTTYLDKHFPHADSHHEKLLPELLLFLRGEFPEIYSQKKKRKWWNPFTWF